MSLICVICNKIIVQSDTKNHYGKCSSCPTDKLTEGHIRMIEESKPKKANGKWN
jgi:hypothetical protein